MAFKVARKGYGGQFLINAEVEKIHTLGDTLENTYIGLDSSQRGTLDSDTGFSLNYVRLNKGNGYSWIGFTNLASGHRVDIGNNRVVVSGYNEYEDSNGALFHIYNLTNLADSNTIVVPPDSSDTVYTSVNPSKSSSFTNFHKEGTRSNPSNKGDMRVAHNHIVLSYADFNEVNGAFVYNIDGTLKTFIHRDDDSNEKLFGTSADIGSGRIVIGDYNYLDSNGTQMGAAFIYDLDGHPIKTIQPPLGYQTPTNAKFGWRVRIHGAKILVSHYGLDPGKVHIYDINGNYQKTIGSGSDPSPELFGYLLEANDGTIVVGGANGTTDVLDSSVSNTYDMDGNMIGYYPGLIDHEFNSEKLMLYGNRLYSYLGRRTDPANGPTHRGKIRMSGKSNDSADTPYFDEILIYYDFASNGGLDSDEVYGDLAAVGDGKMAVTISSWATDGLQDSNSGVYLFDIPKQKNLTNLLDDF